MVRGNTKDSPPMFYSEGLREQMRAVMEAQSQDDVVVRLAKRHSANNVSATLATLHAEFPSLCELVVTPPFTRLFSTTSTRIYNETLRLYTNKSRTAALPGCAPFVAIPCLRCTSPLLLTRCSTR